MATALTPFIYVLLGKSNMLTLLTGISHEKLNTFHQFVGVSCLVLSLVHTIAFMYQPYKEGGSLFLALQFTSFAFYSGIAPLVLLIWLCVASKAYIRKKLYEIFLHMHWMVAIAYFATLWVHIDNTLDMQDYMYGALAFWGTQVLYRILMKTCFKPNKMFMRGRPAKLTRLDENTFEVVIENLAGYSNWKPGQHVFLRFVGTHFLDNHPFSIASMNGHMKFIIVAKKGLTGVLHKQLDDYVTKEKTVYIDGPYGGVARDPLSFDRIVLLGTGSGVTAILPFLLQVANAVELKQAIVTSSISFIWVVRSTDDINWIKNELTHCKEILGDMLDLTIYIADQDLEKHLDSDLTKVISTLNVEYYKPSIVRLVKDLTPTLLTRNMIVSSGSDSMRRDVSSVVSNMQPLIFNNDYHQTGIDEIFLHTEAFCW
jgi:ferric-chelate reductase